MDAYYNQLALQMNFEGANNSTSFIDYSPNEFTFTLSGAPIISTAQSKAGASSLYINGSSSLITPSHSAFAFGASSFVMQMWVYPVTNANSYPNLLSRSSTSVWNTNEWQLAINHASQANKYSFWVYNYSASAAMLVSTSTITYNAWTHIAVVRNGTSFALYINGVSEATATSSANLTDPTASPACVGLAYKGYIDNLSITNGSNRGITGNFTPPTTIDTSHAWSGSITETISKSASSALLLANSGAITELFYISTAMDSAWSKFLADSFSLSTAQDKTVSVIRSATDGLSLSGSVIAKGSLYSTASELIALAATALVKASLAASAADRISMFEAQVLDANIDSLMQVWVANLATAAHSRYAQYGFNSFAKFGGKHYGCKSDGVYELSGDADGTSAIPWTVTFPEMDFGVSNLKRLESVYVGAKATGQLVLKVVQDKNNIYHYNVVPSGNETRAARAVLGRGAVGRYWQLELASDTERAEIDALDFSMAILSRRV